LDTTRGYTAVFPEEVIAAHQFFIERRRTLRPFGEMRPASGEEWTEFEEHFLLRKVALGDCHRPYGTPCVHEHAPLTERTVELPQFRGQFAVCGRWQAVGRAWLRPDNRGAERDGVATVLRRPP